MNRLFLVGLSVFLGLFIACSGDNGTAPDDGNDDPAFDVDHDYNMVAVPTVTDFPMGWDGPDDDAVPVHDVTLSTYWIGQYEVTYELWSDVQGDAISVGFVFTAEGYQGYGSGNTPQDPVNGICWKDCAVWCNAFSLFEGLEPVYYIYSDEAPYERRFINAREDIEMLGMKPGANGFRLPTEAEWECAARYIDGSQWTPGDQHSGYNIDPDVLNCAWTYDNSPRGHLHPVGQLTPNTIGLYDMTGNVEEYCWDWYGIYSSAAQGDPTGPPYGDTRVVHGQKTNNTNIRTSNRRQAPPDDNTSRWRGFRLCRTRL